MTHDEITAKLNDINEQRNNIHDKIMKDKLGVDVSEYSKLEGIDVSDLSILSDKLFEERKDLIKTHLVNDIKELRTVFDGHTAINTEETVIKLITYKHQKDISTTIFKACMGHLIGSDKVLRRAFTDVGDFQGIQANWVEYRKNVVDNLPD